MDQKGLRVVFLYQKYPFLRKLCLRNIRFPEVIILNDLGHRGSPTINFFPGALVVGDAWGRCEYVDTSKGKDKSWYRCWYAGWWCYLKAKIAAGTLIADDAWGRAWVCGQERGGVDGWTGGRVEGGYLRLSGQGAKISAQKIWIKINNCQLKYETF